MSYREYQEMLAGKELPGLPEGWTIKEFKFNEDGNAWYGTVYLKDEVPHHCDFYIWSATNPSIQAGIKQVLGEEYKLVEWASYGNGHFSAKVAKDEGDGNPGL